MGEAGRHAELERKFEVPDAGLTPSFDGVSGIGRTETVTAQSLEAIYFDTAGHHLQSHRVTLRRRRGGADQGWHLKLPADGELRTEVQAPLSDEVPDELRDTVLAIVRDRPLLPVARISTERVVTTLYGQDGSALAEFCDDRVCAQRLDGEPAEQRWREWELEVTEAAAPGAADLLDRLTERLLDAGAAPAAHASKLTKALGEPHRTGDSPADPVHRAVAEQFRRLLECDRAVRADTEDSVHQMRVATRQIRSLLQASEEAFGLRDDAWILSELRELAAILGTARDAEVLGARYRAALDELAPELVRGPVRERLVDGARRHYEAGLRRSLTAIRSPRYFRLLDALEELVASGPPPGADHRHTTVASSYRRLRKAAKAARKSASKTGRSRHGAEHDHAVHRIRKAAKRLRYVAAATGHSRIERRAKDIQTLLGEHQDSVVSRAHLLRQADVAHAAGEDTFTYGVLYRGETERAQRCERKLSAALKKLRRSM